MIYDNIQRNKNNIIDIKNVVSISYIKGPKVEIIGNIDNEYRIQFFDKKNNNIRYETTIRNNHWAKCSVEYFVDWKITVWENGKLFYEEDYDASNRRVYIAIDSKSLGDNLAWFPYIDEFSRKHNCKLVASTFHNELFTNQYPHIEFVSPGETVENLYAMYSLGIFYKDDGTINLYKNNSNPIGVTMQKMASDTLGLEYKEIKPKLETRNVEKDDKLITIAIHGTAQSKYWNNPNGWQDVVDWLRGRGYTVKLLSKEKSGYMGNTHPNGIEAHPVGSIELVMDELSKSVAFIGIGSGLSWLSWALGTKTVLISGFSYDWAEMRDCVRISAPKDVCGGCFNRLRLDSGDWNWCPDYKNTDKQFECTKSITSEMVIRELEKFL
jgi:autotransporter strand-loop-strand O-heptosyltransferase